MLETVRHQTDKDTHDRTTGTLGQSHTHTSETTDAKATTDYRSVVVYTFNPGPREAGAGCSIEEFQDNKDCDTVWGNGRKTTT